MTAALDVMTAHLDIEADPTAPFGFADEMERIVRRVTGMTAPEPPEWDPPKVPRNPAEMADDDLMRVFRELTGWMAYLRFQIAKADTECRRRDRVVAATRARFFREWKDGKKGGVGQGEKEVDGDAGVQRAELDLDATRSYRDLLESMMKNMRDDANTLSRELTRRTSREEWLEGRADSRSA